VELGLDGKRALVAAASGGLGFAIARSLAAEGCRVGICSRDAGRIEEAADRIRHETGGEVTASVCDVGDPGRVGRWIEDVAEAWGGLDVMVPNAGGPPPGRFGDLEPADWDAAYHLTLRSAMETAAAARRFFDRGSALLFLTSASVRQPIGTLVLSTIYRAGVAALAKTLADEWAADGIRVNHLIPGRVATSRVAALDQDAARRLGITPDEVRSGFERAIPLGRYGDPDEFAAAAVFLLSDAASYITGATLQVDGGMLRPIV
jgi:3-oxoacyl-[acyl-carrier protein] reductase